MRRRPADASADVADGSGGLEKRSSQRCQSLRPGPDRTSWVARPQPILDPTWMQGGKARGRGCSDTGRNIRQSPYTTGAGDSFRSRAQWPFRVCKPLPSPPAGAGHAILLKWDPRSLSVAGRQRTRKSPERLLTRHPPNGQTPAGAQAGPRRCIVRSPQVFTVSCHCGRDGGVGRPKEGSP